MIRRRSGAAAQAAARDEGRGEAMSKRDIEIYEGGVNT
jgi:hypothetical protein